MPNLALKQCPHVGCNTIIKPPKTHCDKHKPKPFHNMRKGGRDKFYDSVAWRKTSKNFLSLNPLCIACKNKGIIEPAKHADHILSIDKGGERLSYDNLQPLCIPCHSKKTASNG